MKRTHSILLSLLLFVASTDAADKEEFEKTALTFVDSYCADCHDADSAKGDIILTDLPPHMDTVDSAFRWQKMLEQVRAGVMPPVDKKQPTQAEANEVVTLLEETLLASDNGEAYRKKLLLPQYGNYVDHEKLFSGEIQAPAFSPARIWRLSPDIFSEKPKAGKVKGLQNPFTFNTPNSGIRDYAISSEVGASTVETILLNANAELEYLFAQAANVDPKQRRPNPITPFVIDQAAELTDEQLKAPITSTFNRIVSRQPTEEEIHKYLDFLRANIEQTGDPAGSLAITLKAIYLSPEAIYRAEWGLGEEDKHGRRMLSPDELAYAVAYALFDGGPYNGRDSTVVGRARQEGKLETREDVKALLESILFAEEYRPIGGKNKGTVPRLMRFFDEFFGYKKAIDVFKDNEHVSAHGLNHNPRRLVGDANSLIRIILSEDKNVIERLLTTNEALIFHNGNNEEPIRRYQEQVAMIDKIDADWAREQTERRINGVKKKPLYKNNPKLLAREIENIKANEKNLVEQELKRLAAVKARGPAPNVNRSSEYAYTRSYNINYRDWKWPAEQPFKLPEDQRAGIVTHPAWLVAHSLNDETDPVHRGIWVYEKLLAGVLADVPPDVDAQIPMDPKKTLRERMENTRATRCWACHQKINPLGEAFEIYDDFGRYRDTHFFRHGRNTVKQDFKTKRRR